MALGHPPVLRIWHAEFPLIAALLRSLPPVKAVTTGSGGRSRVLRTLGSLAEKAGSRSWNVPEAFCWSSYLFHSGPHAVGVTSAQPQGLKVNLDIHVLGLTIPNPSAVALLQNPPSYFTTAPPPEYVRNLWDSVDSCSLSSTAAFMYLEKALGDWSLIIALIASIYTVYPYFWQIWPSLMLVAESSSLSSLFSETGHGMGLFCPINTKQKWCCYFQGILSLPEGNLSCLQLMSVVILNMYVEAKPRLLWWANALTNYQRIFSMNRKQRCTACPLSFQLFVIVA